MLRILLSFVLLRRIRARHPELFDSEAAARSVREAIAEHAAYERRIPRRL